MLGITDAPLYNCKSGEKHVRIIRRDARAWLFLDPALSKDVNYLYVKSRQGSPLLLVYRMASEAFLLHHTRKEKTMIFFSAYFFANMPRKENAEHENFLKNAARSLIYVDYEWLDLAPHKKWESEP